MTRSYRYLHLDVFTSSLFGGNQLAVVMDGRGLSDGEMQAIAREMNFSETTFVLPSRRAGCDARVRIFTPGAELPMAGHPTVGTAFALARTGVVGPADARIVFELGVGPTSVDLEWRDADLGFAWMTQQRPQVQRPQVSHASLEAALRLAPGTLRPDLPLEVVSCGVPYLMVPVHTRAGVDQISLDTEAFTRWLRASDLGDLPLFAFTLEPGPEDAATSYSRMFAPAIGLVEDPATGSAAGPLGCYLVTHGVVEENAGTIVNLQGVRMGRPSLIHVAIASAAGAITGVRVGGDAVLAGEGTLYL